SAPIGNHGAPLDPAVMSEHPENGVALRQVRVRLVSAPDGQRPYRLAQHEKTRAVVDLRIDQHDAADGSIAPRTCRLQHGIRLELGKDVGGGVDEGPRVRVAPTDNNRGLGSGECAQRAVAHARTVTAVAVPLRKAATGGRAQHTYLHSRARAGGLAAPRRTGLWSPAARLPALAHLQRFAMYIVISMPKRKSVARGVSQRIVLVPALGQLD